MRWDAWEIDCAVPSLCTCGKRYKKRFLESKSKEGDFLSWLSNNNGKNDLSLRSIYIHVSKKRKAQELSVFLFFEMHFLNADKHTFSEQNLQNTALVEQ